EYVTDRLVEQAAGEIVAVQPDLLVEQPLIMALAKDHIRQSQERLIGEPILRHVQSDNSSDEAEQQLLALLHRWRARSHAEQGYGPGNVVTLLRLLRGDLRGLDLSRLSIRQAYFQETDAQDTSLATTHVEDAVLAGAFSRPTCVALDADGTFLGIGTAGGDVA